MEIEKNIEIEIITDEDDSLKILGELLANKTSRDLMKFLMSKSTYKMKISDELGVPFSLVEHHLKKLEKLGLVKITNKKLIKDGVLHKTYKITADGIFLMLNTTKKEIDEKGILKRIFKDSVKFAGLFLVSTIPALIQIFTTIQDNSNFDYDRTLVSGTSLFYGAVIIIIGLIADKINLFRKKRKKGL